MVPPQLCLNTNPWGCSQFPSHRGKFVWDELREMGSENCIFFTLQLNSYLGLKRFENGIKWLIFKDFPGAAGSSLIPREVSTVCRFEMN